MTSERQLGPSDCSAERPPNRSRRRLLALGGAAVVGGLAGCVGSLSGSSAAETTTEAGRTTTGSSQTTADPGGSDSALEDHPAATRLDDQPRWGPPPRSAEGVVVAFEDPSCPRCAAFETGTVPKLRNRLGDRLSFVLRSYPVVYPWGEPATQAIEATFAHEMEMRTDSSAGGTEKTTTDLTAGAESAPYGSRQGSVATWALARHYFEAQDQFDESNVLDRTRSFLAEQTDLAAEAVVADAEAKTYDDAVQADLDAGEAAEVGRTTPTVFLFRDGEFRTSATGSVSFQVVESALGL